MNKQYEFSIIIPTRNRVDTIKYTLQTCIDQRDFDNYEIIINDNSDDDQTKIYVAKLMSDNHRARQKIKYHKRADICSMSRNFEEAILRAEGDYVIVIGDDDGILPLALSELSKLVAKTGAGVIKWRNGLYNWPSMTFQNAAHYLGFCLQRSFQTLSAKDELVKSLEILNYDNLPMLYINAAVRRDVVESLRDGDGRMFRSRSPDVYSAIAIAYRCGEYIDTTIPFTIAGLSHFSNGVSTAFEGDNTAPRVDFWKLNWQDGIHHHGHVPNLAVFPIVDLADSFYHAKGFYFSDDDTLKLPRWRIMQACIERCDTSVPEVRNELMRACEDDAELTRLVLELLSKDAPCVPGPRLKPVNLGADGVNLHLDASEFGVETIKDAVGLVHKIVWPADAPLRYDLQSTK